MQNLRESSIPAPTTTALPWWRMPSVWVLLAAIVTSAAAWWLIAWPVASISNVDKHPDHFGMVFVHMIGGTIMLFIGAANLYIGTTNKLFKYHKLLGRTYLIGGTLGVAFVVAVLLSTAHKSNGIFTNTTISLLTLATAWLASAAMAYRSVRNGKYGEHREWIVRSYVLAWSFVFCRIASRVPGVESIGGGEAFIWLSWVAPILICEFLLHWRSTAKVAV
ncbi:hypothetical protein BH10ACI2_BH10ACI2_06290 [soil metagenome]